MIVVQRLVWEPWNIAHIALHQVTLDEVEEVCQGHFLAYQTYQGRLLLIGPTAAGRMLGVVLEPQELETYYPVTARPASRKERRLYEATWQGGQSYE